MTPAERIAQLKEAVSLLPTTPGVYQFFDASGRVMYVGKAVNLRRRVGSYFVDSKKHSAKVRVMVAKIVALKHIDTPTEHDALLLENSLIKTLRPRYNILLKDDKTYPWIVVRNEPFPRVESTRRVVRDGSAYFGPYSSVMSQRAMLESLKEIYQLRTCKLSLDEVNIRDNKYRVCLEYHLGNCSAPCVGHQTAEEYAATIDMVKKHLRGDLGPTRNYLTEKMQAAAEVLNFEKAAAYKRRLDALAKYEARSVIVSPTLGDVDVFALVVDDLDAYCNFVRVARGTVVASRTALFTLGAESDKSTILTQAIRQMIPEVADGRLAREVIVAVEPDEEFEGVRFTVPQRGDKLKLLEFAHKGAVMFRAERLKNMEIKNPERHTERLMAALQRELYLDRQPRYIECFDNSNLQGTHPVAACVVFRDGKPSRKEYRHFNVKTVVGPDDFATMREIITRRYTRVMNEGGELPDLIIVDGGKGQLSSACEVLKELGLWGKVPIVGLAERLEEIYFPNDPKPYYLDRTGEPLKVVRHIRDEAHRFGITFHRNKRSADFTTSELEHIEGIGPKSVEALLKAFGSVAKVRKATREALAREIGEAKAQRVFDYFHK
ncbi:MAG: excinuclease ABC subunit C [Tidjanibacter sp.]|nr:excinuclease ABC subunit C [Tidjanibacter sp.]